MIKLTAFHKWLYSVGEGDTLIIANILLNEIVKNNNPQAYDLLDATGDERYTKTTFLKASELLVETLKTKP